MISVTDVEQLRRDLMTPEKQVRKAALERMRGWKSAPIERDAAHLLLTAAALGYPEVPGTFGSPNAELVRVLWDHPGAVDPRFVEQSVPSLPEDAQLAAIRLLAASPAGAAALAEVLRAVEGGRLVLSPGYYPVLLPLQRSPHSSGELAGPLIALLDRVGWTDQAGAALLAFATTGALDETQERELAARLDDQLPARLSGLADVLSVHGRDARWSEDTGYTAERAATGLLLGLASRTNDDRLATAFREAAGHPDPWLVT